MRRAEEGQEEEKERALQQKLQAALVQTRALDLREEIGTAHHHPLMLRYQLEQVHLMLVGAVLCEPVEFFLERPIPEHWINTLLVLTRQKIVDSPANDIGHGMCVCVA